MNPKPINTTNVVNFGFKTVIDTELRKIIFDITGLTTFNTGGAAAIPGISFEVIDPSGVTIHEVQFAPPDIDPNVIQTYELNLPSGTSLFGYYRVKGVLQEASGALYELVLPAKEVCEPKGYDGDVVPGTFKETINCDAPTLQLNETTPLVYMGKEPSSKIKNGKLYYPLGTVDDLSFTKTPFRTSQVYTGDHVVRNKTIADYDLGDLFYVRISYTTNYKFPVTCQSRLCDIMCCLEDNQRIAEKECNNAKGRRAKELQIEVTPYVMQALAKEACGKDAGEVIARIKKILNCDCNDCNSRPIEPNPLSAGGGKSFVFEGDCATTVDVVEEGDTETIKYKTKNVIVRKGEPDQPAFLIIRTEDECNIYWTIQLNYEEIAAAIFTATASNNTLLTQLNSLIAITGVSVAIAGLDGKCVIDLASCDYTLTHVTGTNNSVVISIIIDGVTYVAPGSGILMTSPGSVQAWLNSLAKGAWAANWVADGSPPGGTFSLTSAANTHTIGTLQITSDTVPSTLSIPGNCKTLKQILQAIIDYVCTINTAQMRLGITLSVCRVVNGQTVTTNYGSNTALQEYLSAVSLANCEVANQLVQVVTLNCLKIRGVFPASAAAIQDNDVLLGTKSGNCAETTYLDIAKKIFELAQNNAEVKAQFCAVTCDVDTCPSITSITAATA
jgi:hypothetical protein